MTQIDVVHRHGEGVKAKFDVLVDGKKVAFIRRDYRKTWTISDAFFGEDIATFATLAKAKKGALSVRFPTKKEVYEMLCNEVEQKRRDYIEQVHAHKLASICREIANGSNSAREELDFLLRDIETYAKDRTATNWKDDYSRDPLYPEW